MFLKVFFLSFLIKKHSNDLSRSVHKLKRTLTLGTFLAHCICFPGISCLQTEVSLQMEAVNEALLLPLGTKNEVAVSGFTTA